MKEITPEKIKKIMAEQDTIVRLDEAKIILDFMIWLTTDKLDS